MKRMMMMVALAAFLVAALSVSALSAFAAAPQCGTGASSDNGCKTDVGPKQHSGNSSADFNTQTTETQRGNTNAQGTQDTEIKQTTCTGPSGNELRPTHPQCS